MKSVIAIVLGILISVTGISQIYTFNTHYVKVENGYQPQLMDSFIRTIEFKNDVIVVTNLFGCEYTNEFTIVEKLNQHTYVIAYEGKEVVVMYSPSDNILVVTNGVGVKGERTIHIYGEQNPIHTLL